MAIEPKCTAWKLPGICITYKEESIRQDSFDYVAAHVNVIPHINIRILKPGGQDMMNNQSITKHAYVWPTRATFASSLCAAIAIDSLTTRTSEQSSEVSELALFAPSF